MNMGFNVFSIVVVVLAILTLFAGVKTVSQGYNGPSSGSGATRARFFPASI
jgi:hypothetical protein